MTPNEICREIVTRLQLGGGVKDLCDIPDDDWRVRMRDTRNCPEMIDFANLNDVAIAIRAVGDGRTYSVEHVLRNGGDYRASVGNRCSYLDCTAFGATEAEALTRALHAYLRANKIGEEFLTPPEPEEPWIDVSESVSLANLPKVDMECEVDNGAEKGPGWLWDGAKYKWRSKEFNRKPKALGGSVIRWRYAK